MLRPTARRALIPLLVTTGLTAGLLVGPVAAQEVPAPPISTAPAKTPIYDVENPGAGIAPAPGSDQIPTTDANTTPEAPSEPSAPTPPPSTVDAAKQRKDLEELANAQQAVALNEIAKGQTAQRYAQAMTRAARLEIEIKAVSRKIPLQQRRVESLRNVMRTRAAIMYRDHDLLEEEIAFDDMDAKIQAQRQARLVGAVAEEDTRRAIELQRHAERLKNLEAELDAKETELEKVLNEIETQRQKIEADLAVAQQLLAEKKTELRIVSADGLVCPIAGPVTFTNDWGNPRSGGRTHKGTDMMTPFFTPNVAIVSGTITFDNDNLGGLGVHLWGDDGNLYYYAHLSSFEGQPRRVLQGEIVGYAGDSGNARGGASHTHFQIHPQRGAPTNPYPTVGPLCLGVTGLEPSVNAPPPNS